ncbi:nicotinate-nucleotide--dimethylbenzimidazole phosphoribosyltransferase [Candidatus Hakubella thermalkaliphila]|uniref:Nicotinate-nucleotide--dimethylbenzimidazole phosphoribosyltransferase n=2 Tax=Candidatus Hakubella thermalkaliphila TaxID=2754717 RepID=A0A6V8QDV3_9ACTN|nr:Nicotinate-nucleotide--dimethylbenzimidazole phosphoribosyltransferase [Actinomycetota bacterium]GFP20066.1 nicotinate-nucleotide--dimethylbenzimidazole phosphoribosyltransferase [Candidatus Hakubella thermalkaliphila]GFP31252.1 nicotinate-nucleotide--dimethylbenzimidazole phosphoribosyltransferase [Candidatus Hakubella thermalkaliphila]GFP40409.1 nicotinate-nucleotide--dimethylbenzimidazole phosphoribosyltransferase [Candidatus Hakubella thermalkaliphila]GFP42244.1 nicotinate-nucleotide--di
MQKVLDVMTKIGHLDERAMQTAQARQDTLTKPAGSLGRLEELSVRVAGITGNPLPKIVYKVILTMAADHGVVAEGVSAYPQKVTSQMVYNFLRGGAAINVLARHVGARVVVVDMGVAADLEPHPALVDKKIAYGTQNMATGPAMTREEAIRALEAGIEIVEEQLARGMDILATGDMGIGNTTPSSAIVAAITGRPAAEVTGRGTGIDDTQLKKKIAIIEQVLEVNRPDPEDPLDVLAKVGGLEIGGLTGAILAGAAHRIPVVIDGFISGAAAVLAIKLCPKVQDFLIASHCSVEIGHQIVLQHVGLKPLMNMDLRLGEGTGAALGIGIVEASLKILAEMTTFAEAGVAEKKGEADASRSAAHR